MRRLLALVVMTALATGCAASAEDDAASSSDALTSLTAAACKTPNITTTPAKDAAGVAIPGTALTDISGCIVGKSGETGQNVTARLAALLGDTASLGRVTAPDGSPVFASFAPGHPSGTLATELVQDVDVKLAVPTSPAARLRITRKLAADGTYSLRITNVTPFVASVLFVSVTAIQTGKLSLDLTMKPQANGLSVSGVGSVKLEVQQDQAAGAAEIVHDVFSWLTNELAR